MSFAWFTYELERPPIGVNGVLSDAGHRWLYAVGAYPSESLGLQGAELTVLRRGGMRFAKPQPAAGDPEEIGSALLEWSSCNAATMDYLLFEASGWKGGEPEQSGRLNLERVVGEANVGLCHESLTQACLIRRGD
jgi:hypothetical protein